MTWRTFEIVAAMVVASAANVWAGNAVLIESKGVSVGATGESLGIYITNEISLNTIVLPLELRSVDSGAFIAGPLGVSMGGRFTVWDSAGACFIISVHYDAKMDSTPPGRGYPPECLPDSAGLYWSYLTESPIYTSPVAMVYASIGIDPLFIASGDDGVPGDGSPSLYLTFDVTAVEGQFEVETTCVRPANHLVFGNDLFEPVAQIGFTKGVVTIGCGCDCHTDPVCDGVHDVFDIVKIVDVALRGGDPVIDPNPMCPYENTNVNCDAGTDIIDLTLMMLVVNSGADPDSTFCEACP